MNSIRGSGSLLRNPVVTLSPVGMRGKSRRRPGASVTPTPRVSEHSNRTGGLHYGKEGSKRKIATQCDGEAFIENGRTVKNNRTIGYCSDDAGAIGMLALFSFYVDMCIHVKEMSTKCH
jgi:hypothetical protein